MPDDRELWERIRRGDAQAFDAFYREMGPRLLGFLRQIVGNRQAAEDVMQETFTQIWRTPNGFVSEKGTLRTYVFGAARRRGSEWWRKRLGTALAFVMLGAGLGAMILPVIAQAVVTRSGWRAAYFALGGLALLLGLPLSWRYVFERGGAVKEEAAPVEHEGLTFKQGLRSYAYWIIVAVLFVSSISMNGAITHLSAMLTDRGITPGNAALCASVLGGSSILGRIGIGWLPDRMFGARVAFAVSLVTAAGVLLLARAGSFSSGCLAAALIGIGAGGEAAITPYLLTRYFGLRAFSTLCGLTWTFYAAAGATGPVILGRAFDSTGSYASLLGILAVALAVAGVVNLLLPKYPPASAPQAAVSV